MSKTLVLKYLHAVKDLYTQKLNEDESSVTNAAILQEVHLAVNWIYGIEMPTTESDVLEQVFVMVGDWLDLNGFEKVDKLSYANEYCTVVITEQGLEITDNNYMTSYINCHKIPYLIGVLYYRGLMSPGESFKL